MMMTGNWLSKPFLALLTVMSVLFAVVNVASAQVTPTSTPETINRPIIDEQAARVLGRMQQAIVGNAADSIFTPTANVGPTGRCSHTNGDGSPFTASAGGVTFSGDTAAFSADECSVLGSVQFDFTDSNFLGDGTTFLVGFFGGYTSLDVDYDRSAIAIGLGVPGATAENGSGIVGGYVTVARDGFYGVGSVGYMFGHTEVDNFIQSAHGEYDNSAYSLSGTIGKILPVSSNLNIDLRGGLQYVNHRGDAFIDTAGNIYGRSKVAYWQGQVSAGVFSTIVSGDMSFQPYARAALSTEFNFESNSSVNGFVFDYDSANDLTLSLSTGVLANISKQVQLSGEVSYDYSKDEDTIAGKLGVKFRF